MRLSPLFLSLLLALPAGAAEPEYPDLPGGAQATTAINSSLAVQAAEQGVKIERSNLRRWVGGTHEFNIRAGSAQRRVVNGGTMKEWDIAIERPLRLPNKLLLDQEIGSRAINRSEYALGDARHEAGRSLLRLWFNWQREVAAAGLWQQQSDLLQQQTVLTEKRVKAGDAPRMELNQAQSAAAQANISRQQAQMRAQLASSELLRQFPGLVLPKNVPSSTPQSIPHDLAYWKGRVFQHNHELGMAQSDHQLQNLLAERSRADRLPDPTLGLRYANEMGGNEKVTGVYVSIPLSFGLRSAQAEGMQYQAEAAASREQFVQHRLEGDVLAAYTQAISSHASWQQATEAAASIRQNAELVSRAYALGESSLSDTLTARRLAVESALAEITARLEANEARYRLLLDAHLLWPLDTDDDLNHDHY